MVSRVLKIYVTVTVLVAAGVLAALDWGALVSLPSSALAGLAALTFLGLFSEASAFTYRVGTAGGSSSLVFLPLVAAAILFGGPPTVAFVVLTAGIGEFLIRRNPPIKAVFNTAQYVNATAAAAFAFSLAGGHPLAQGVLGDANFDPQVAPVLAFGVVALTLNHVAVAIAIALSRKEKIWDFGRLLGTQLGGTVVNDLMVLPIAILVAFLYFELQVLGLFVSLLPLIFIRYSYLSKFRLEEANRDLLQALVKAIETRDPYTSGHSIRVKSLARKIGLLAGLSMRQAGELETAALLHDIGKIEVVYEEILQKPGSLTPQERAVIESHVDRGVEILTSLTSFSDRIIDAVRHHHELYDGSGYPDGLKADKIPIYARIIKLTDAIDAMLSDRPYRTALTLDEVRRELRRFAGIHFDPVLIERVAERGLLEEYAEEMQLDRSLSERRLEPVDSRRIALVEAKVG